MKLETYKVFDTRKYCLNKFTVVITCLELTSIECVAGSLYTKIF
jgi:hypothetical protein